MRRSIVIALSVLSFSLPAAHADLLGLSLAGLPDITSTLIHAEYDATADLFSATGSAASLTYDGITTNSITGGVFSVSANVDGSGALYGSPKGSLNITGTQDVNASPLLTGDLVAFGYGSPADSTNSYFDFLFKITGGSLASAFGGLNGLVYTFLDTMDSSFTGSFASNYSNGTHYGVADTVPIPAPSSVTLGVLGAIALCCGARRRSLTPITAAVQQNA